MKQDYKNFKQIIDEYNIINVPYYQRDYVWGNKNNGRNLYKFIDDIFTQYSENPESNYFIGTLAFCSAETNDVIDGQQRITSLVLVLSRLSALKCSEQIKEENKKLLCPKENTFIIQEENYLTEELKCRLGLVNNFNTQGYNVDISKTIQRIDKQINDSWGGKTVNWYDSLYAFIMNNVKFISLEYSNIGESLKYFLNINSLSVPLTQSDIFYSILSQSLRISQSLHSIFDIRDTVTNLAETKGLEKEFDEYKAYEQECNKAIDNILFIFLNAYYQDDKDIQELAKTGIGKWMSFYKNEVFKDAIIAQKFVENFIAYLDDFKKLKRFFTTKTTQVKDNSSIRTSWILLTYENSFGLLKFLNDVFRTRHNYREQQPTLYKNGTTELDTAKLEEIAKRLNLTLLNNYIKSGNKILDGFIKNIKLKDEQNYTRSLDDIKTDIQYDDIFTLNYNDKKGKSNVKIKDESKNIKVIFALQQAFLSKTASCQNSCINDYLEDILYHAEIFSIEHLYSITEFEDKERRTNWQTLKNKFFDDTEFDSVRYSFENLSLLNKSLNSSANNDVITEKLTKYKQANKIKGSEAEYLILSLVNDSDFYNNEKIKALELPERKLQRLEQNTWELSENNREFNTKLLEMAVNEIASL